MAEKEEPIFVDLGQGVTLEASAKKDKKSDKKHKEAADIDFEEVKEKLSSEDENKKDNKKQTDKRSGKVDIEQPEKEKKKERRESEKVNVDDLKKEKKDEDVVIDFMNADESEDFINKKTKTSELNIGLEDNEESQFKGKSSEEIRDQIKNEEEEQSNKFTPEDYEEIAGLIVNILDMLFSALLRWWAKDTTDQPYQLNKGKKKTVTYQLTLLMIKYQKKWSIELMFILTIIAVYSGPAIAAQKHRKEVKNGTAKKRGKGTQEKN